MYLYESEKRRALKRFFEMAAIKGHTLAGSYIEMENFFSGCKALEPEFNIIWSHCEGRTCSLPVFPKIFISWIQLVLTFEVTHIYKFPSWSDLWTVFPYVNFLLSQCFPQTSFKIVKIHIYFMELYRFIRKDIFIQWHTSSWINFLLFNRKNCHELL